MSGIKRILLATDFAVTSEPARDRAAALAARHGAELHVLYVHVLLQETYGWSGYPRIIEFERAIEEEAEKAAHEHAAQIPRPAGVKIIEATERDVSAAAAIKRYAVEHDIDLIVVGTHRRQGVARWFMGSVAAEVVRGAPTSVLVVGPEHAAAGDDECILAATDFSEASTAALRFAAELARDHDAKLVVTHVIESLKLPPYYTELFVEADRKAARKALDATIASAKLPVSAESIVSSGRPHERIGALARELAADLIVMGSHGLHGLDRLLMGSVTERVLRDASCPVLAHRERVKG